MVHWQNKPVPNSRTFLTSLMDFNCVLRTSQALKIKQNSKTLEDLWEPWPDDVQESRLTYYTSSGSYPWILYYCVATARNLYSFTEVKNSTPLKLWKSAVHTGICMWNSRTTNTITTETYRVILITNASQTLHCHRPTDGKHLSVSGWRATVRKDLQQLCTVSESWGAGVVICLERGADLHMAQLMPLLLTVSWFSKIQIGLPFLVPAHLGSPGKRAVKRVCVCVYSNMHMCRSCFIQKKGNLGKCYMQAYCICLLLNSIRVACVTVSILCLQIL